MIEEEISEMGFDEIFADAPTFPPELIEECRQSLDISPILFEWYKYIGRKCLRFSVIDFSSSVSLREIPPVHRGIFVGLLIRCARLMLANMKLSEGGEHGETTRIIDRCIAESAVKIRWLVYKDDRDAFVRYLANGLKKDFDLQDLIWKNVANRAGDGVVIEKRMLTSIQRKLEQSGLTELEVLEAKEMPDLATIFKDLGLTDDEYTIMQRIGSHSVHGTWSDLVAHYLVEENGEFLPSDDPIPTHGIQYVVICLLVLWAMADYLFYIVKDRTVLDGFAEHVKSVEQSILDLHRMVRGKDWEPEQV